MAVHKIYVVKPTVSPEGEMSVEIIGIDIKKWDHGVLELKKPHPYFMNKTLIPMNDKPAYTPLAAVERFSESCKVVIEEKEEEIKKLQHMRELAGQQLLLDAKRGN